MDHVEGQGTDPQSSDEWVTDIGPDGQRATWPKDDGTYDPKTDRFGWL
jgi:hypothetical protein